MRAWQEKEVLNASSALLYPYNSLQQLLYLLDKLETCLTKLDQFPSKSMRSAIHHVSKVLLLNQLFNHTNSDVKVSVASCINEIIRITAPHAPYDDSQMKDIFHLIIGAFENISETTSPSYSKRVSILKNVASVRSWSLMLDLDCHTLIPQMFRLFFSNIRDIHSDDVFSSMGLIMILLLEELNSEEITPQLLSPLLDSVRTSNTNVLPIAQKLAERVIENCSSKLRPYMTQAVEYMGFPLDDYHEIVASLCENRVNTLKYIEYRSSKDNVMRKLLANQCKKVAKTVSYESGKLPKTCCKALVSTDKEIRCKKKASSARCSTNFSSTESTCVVESLKNKCKRQKILKRDEASFIVANAKDLGEKLVGSVIKIWRPKEQEFYNGVVREYDSSKGAYKVLYGNGCEELLSLGKERWEFSVDESVSNRRNKVDNLCSGAPLQL